MGSVQSNSINRRCKMLSRKNIFALSFAAGLLIASAAAAATGWATGNVNMRTCGSTRCAKITTIPAGAAVNVYHCGAWCELDFAGYHGFASARYISLGRYRRPPPVVVAPVPLPPTVYWYYGRPRWDPRYRSWHSGDRWWYDHGWHRRPPRSGFTLEFHF